MLIVLSERHLGLEPAGFAWLIVAIGAGTLLGPLVPNALARDYRDAHWLFVPYIIRGVGDVMLAVFTPLPVALILLLSTASTRRRAWWSSTARSRALYRTLCGAESSPCWT